MATVCWGSLLQWLVLKARQTPRQWWCHCTRAAVSISLHVLKFFHSLRQALSLAQLVNRTFLYVHRLSCRGYDEEQSRKPEQTGNWGNNHSSPWAWTTNSPSFSTGIVEWAKYASASENCRAWGEARRACHQPTCQFRGWRFSRVLAYFARSTTPEENEKLLVVYSEPVNSTG